MKGKFLKGCVLFCALFLVGCNSVDLPKDNVAHGNELGLPEQIVSVQGSKHPLEVNGSEENFASSVSVPEQMELVLNLKESQKIEYKVEPATVAVEEILYASDNTAVAVVDPYGVVTAVGTGECQILVTVVSRDGSEICAKMPVFVAVAPKSLTIEGISLLTGKTAKLGVLTAPERVDAGDVFSWVSSNPDVATVDENGNVKGVSAGTSMITVTNELGQSASCKITVEKAKQNESSVGKQDKGVFGQWSIPVVGVNVACYETDSQAVVDKKDSAAMFQYGSQLVIADHNYQGFDAIKQCKVGTVAYWETAYGKQKYVCTGLIKGHNVNNSLTDENYNSVGDLNPGGITCYTCDGNKRNVVIVFFRPVSEDGIVTKPFVVTKENRDLVGYTGAVGEELVIPASFRGEDGVLCQVVAIEDQAFKDCVNLKSVVLPDSVSKIGYRAFYGCKSLVSVVLPKDLVSFGASAFSESGITSVVLPESLQDVGNAFSRCRKLESLTLPQGVQEIQNSAFAGCNSLQRIELPAGVVSIGDSAFSGCTKLTDVFFDGTEEQWSKVAVGAQFNKPFACAVMHFEG